MKWLAVPFLTTILLVKDHAPERKESFFPKIKVSAFVNFEVYGTQIVYKLAPFPLFSVAFGWEEERI